MVWGYLYFRKSPYHETHKDIIVLGARFRGPWRNGKQWIVFARPSLPPFGFHISPHPTFGRRMASANLADAWLRWQPTNCCKPQQSRKGPWVPQQIPRARLTLPSWGVAALKEGSGTPAATIQKILRGHLQDIWYRNTFLRGIPNNYLSLFFGNPFEKKNIPNTILKECWLGIGSISSWIRWNAFFHQRDASPAEPHRSMDLRGIFPRFRFNKFFTRV